MKALIAELERATEGLRELDCAIQEHDYRTGDINPSRYVNGMGPFWKNKYNDNWFEVARYTTSLDAALTLVPDTACNHHLFSFKGHGIEISGFPKTAWAFGFCDTAQLMGERAAKEKIERMIHLPGWGDFSGPPRVKMEKAIAEHFIEFNCQCAATPALAVCPAALRARQAMKENG